MTNPDILNSILNSTEIPIDDDNLTKRIDLGDKRLQPDENELLEITSPAIENKIQILAACSAVSGAILGFLLSGLFTLAIAVFVSSLVSFAVGWKAGVFGTEGAK